MADPSGGLVMEERGRPPAEEQGAGGAGRPRERPPKPPGPGVASYDVVIIGAGPAGYTAGIYCARARRSTLIIPGPLPGGQLVNTTDVENYPGFEEGVMGPDLVERMRKQAERMGARIGRGEVVNVDFRRRPLKVLTAEEEYEARAVIIATGASPRKLGVEGEAEFAGKGVSYCATCDGAFFKGQEVVVVGGGDSAMEEATFLTKFASAVHVVHRRSELRASRIMQERAAADPKVRTVLSYRVARIAGGDRVERVHVEGTEGGPPREIAAGAVFVAVGHDPNSSVFSGQVRTDPRGYVEPVDGTATSAAGVFVAGDVHDHRYRQAVTAAGYGCMAALDAERYLSSQ